MKTALFLSLFLSSIFASAFQRECRIATIGAGMGAIGLKCGDYAMKFEGVLVGVMFQRGHATLTCDHDFIDGGYHAIFGTIGLAIFPAPVGLWLIKKGEDGQCFVSGFHMGALPLGVGYGFATIKYRSGY